MDGIGCTAYGSATRLPVFRYAPIRADTHSCPILYSPAFPFFVRGIDALLSTKVQLGGDISVAAGPVGAGAQAATTDILAFARNKGVFGGISLEGSVISPRHKLNQAYYGKEVRPVDILIRRDVNNPHAMPLISAVTKAAKTPE